MKKGLILAMMFVVVFSGTFVLAKGYEEHPVRGLDNALMKVTNEQAKKVLEDNMYRIRERLRIRENQTVVFVENADGGFEARIHEKARIMGLIPAELVNKADIDENGEVIQERENFWFRYGLAKKLGEVKIDGEE